VKTVEIDRAVDSLLRQPRATPLFKGYQGRVPFPASTCISVKRNRWCMAFRSTRDQGGRFAQDRHGVQAQRLVRRRRVTLMIGEVSPAKKRLVEVAEQCCASRWWS